MRLRAVPRPSPHRIFLTALLSAPLLMSAVRAQDAAPDPTKLKALERALEQTEAERDRLQSQAATSARALEAIRGDMIATAKEIQDQEHSLTLLEARITDLERDGERLTSTLGRRDVQMVEALLAIERLALRPSDALTLNPLAPSDAVRSAILLRAALPSIKQSSAALQGDLKQLYAVRAEITDRKEQAAAGALQLVEKHKRLDGLAREKASQHEVLVARGENANQRVMTMAREADDLRALFAKLAEEKALREKAERALEAEREKERKIAAQKATEDAKTVQPPAGRIILKAPAGVVPAPGQAPSPGASGDEKQLAALPPVTRTPGGDEESVTRSFAKARGTMPFPVAGSLTNRYGAAAQTPGEAGLLAKGITISARGGAQVVAPFDGLIAFAGPFRGYGQLLIIEHSEGYHTLLAGMGHIDARVGQRVLAGEPIGVMENEGAPALYVELRRDGQPINPLPWLADRAGKKSG